VKAHYVVRRNTKFLNIANTAGEVAIKITVRRNVEGDRSSPGVLKLHEPTLQFFRERLLRIMAYSFAIFMQFVLEYTKLYVIPLHL